MIAPPFVAVPPARYGGTELVLAALADGLVARGHTVLLYGSGDSTAGSALRAHFPAALWPPNPYLELTQAATAAWDLLARADADVVHAHLPAALAFTPLYGRPVVYTVHHDQEPGFDALLQAASGPALTCVAISHRQRARLGGVPAEVVHHGLPPERYPLGAGGAHVAYLGRFAEQKGVAAAIDAARLAGAPIRLAGRPHPGDADYWRAEVAPRLEGPGVRWFGEVGQEGKVRLLGGAFATLFPIAWEEPFGLVMIESMLCGTPVVAYGRGSVPEVIEEGVTGFVVPDLAAMAERVRRLARERFDRARCREAAVARFGASRMVSAYLGVYGAAVGSARVVGAR